MGIRAQVQQRRDASRAARHDVDALPQQLPGGGQSRRPAFTLVTQPTATQRRAAELIETFPVPGTA